MCWEYYSRIYYVIHFLYLEPWTKKPEEKPKSDKSETENEEEESEEEDSQDQSKSKRKIVKFLNHNQKNPGKKAM